MGYYLYFTKLKRERLPPCGEEFVGGKVWQHWYVDDDLKRCEALELYSQKNKDTNHRVFISTFMGIGVDASEAMTEVSKEMLVAVIQELDTWCQKITDALDVHEVYWLGDSWYDEENLKQLQDFKPILLEIQSTFDFEEYVLTVNWA
jgi:hypothetical protein